MNSLTTVCNNAMVLIGYAIFENSALDVHRSNWLYGHFEPNQFGLNPKHVVKVAKIEQATIPLRLE